MTRPRLFGCRLPLRLNGDAAEAKKVFRADLERNPRNPRSLFGLVEALKAQGRSTTQDSYKSNLKRLGKAGFHR